MGLRGGRAQIGVGTTTRTRVRIWARVRLWGGSTVAATIGGVVAMLVMVVVMVVVNRDCSGPSCDFPNAMSQIRYTASTRARAWVRVRSGESWRHPRPPPLQLGEHQR